MSVVNFGGIVGAAIHRIAAIYGMAIYGKHITSIS